MNSTGTHNPFSVKGDGREAKRSGRRRPRDPTLSRTRDTPPLLRRGWGLQRIGYADLGGGRVERFSNEGARRKPIVGSTIRTYALGPL